MASQSYHILIRMYGQFKFTITPSCFWELEGNQKAQRKPTETQGERETLYTDSNQSSGTNQGPWRLTDMPQCHPKTFIFQQV